MGIERDAKEAYPQRWGAFWLGAGCIMATAVMSALVVGITDPEKLIPLMLSTVFYGVIVGFISKAVATRAWRKKRAEGLRTVKTETKTGIGGWLLTLICLLAFSAIVSVVAASANYLTLIDAASPHTANTYFGWKVVLSVAASLPTAYAIYRLTRVRHRASVTAGITAVWLQWAIFAAATKLLFFALTGEAPSLMGPVATIGFSAIWTAYLLRSARVRNTYPALETRPLA